MALLSPSDPAGVRSISLQPWFIQVALTPGLLTAQLVLPVALPFWVMTANPNWNTTVYIVDGTQTQKGCTLKFSTVIPTGGQLNVAVIG